MKRVEPKSLRQIIDEVVNSSGNRTQYLQHKAADLWIDVMGPGIAHRTTRRYVSQDGVLHVYLTSASLKQELSFSRSSIVAEINRRLGADILTDIAIH